MKDIIEFTIIYGMAALLCWRVGRFVASKQSSEKELTKRADCKSCNGIGTRLHEHHRSYSIRPCDHCE